MASLSPSLDDIRNIIVSKSLGPDVICRQLDGELIVTDESIIPLTVIASSIEPGVDGIGICLEFPIGPAVNRHDPQYAEFERRLQKSFQRNRLISLIDERTGGWCKWGCGVRFAWTSNPTELRKSLEHNLSILKRYWIKHEKQILLIYEQTEIDILSDEEFDQLPPLSALEDNS